MQQIILLKDMGVLNLKIFNENISSVNERLKMLH